MVALAGHVATSGIVVGTQLPRAENALSGVSSSEILYAQAARLRPERFRVAERRAAALGVKLVIPLGLWSLPAFVCLGIVPVLLAMLPQGS